MRSSLKKRITYVSKKLNLFISGKKKRLCFLWNLCGILHLNMTQKNTYEWNIQISSELNVIWSKRTWFLLNYILYVTPNLTQSAMWGLTLWNKAFIRIIFEQCIIQWTLQLKSRAGSLFDQTLIRWRRKVSMELRQQERYFPL